jgi:histone deacetylase 6
VLYFSIHRLEEGFYPGTGHTSEVGSEHARGTTVNLPIPMLMGDSEYLEAFDKLLLPIANEFEPDLILISAGFDAVTLLRNHRNTTVPPL